jgi:hypothetical protein
MRTGHAVTVTSDGRPARLAATAPDPSARAFWHA